MLNIHVDGELLRVSLRVFGAKSEREAIDAAMQILKISPLERDNVRARDLCPTCSAKEYLVTATYSKDEL